MALHALPIPPLKEEWHCIPPFIEECDESETVLNTFMSNCIETIARFEEMDEESANLGKHG